MRRLTLLLFGFFVCNWAAASHYSGGEISYRNLSQTGSGLFTYEISFRIYSDCLHGSTTTIEQDLPLYYAIFDGTGNRVIIDTSLNGIYQTQNLNYLPGCYHDTNRYCGKYAQLTRTVTLPANATGYTIINQRCCMGSEINNVIDPGQHGLTLFCTIPGTNLINAANSSPSFRVMPPLRMCINSSFSLDFGATDADGDSLAYRFISGLLGGADNNAKPIPASATLPGPLPYAPFYSYAQPLGGGGTLSLNPSTGILAGRCSNSGDYLVCVACDEYRGGVRIGTIVRDYVLEVANCYKEVTALLIRDSAAVVAGIDSLSMVRCGGSRSISFQNISTGATRFHWDFGVAGRDDDTSALPNPQFTYPAPGKYPLTLIAYGTNCADTLHGAVWLSDDVLQPDFSISGGTCLLDTVILRDASTAVAPASIAQYGWQTGGESAGGTAIGLILQQPGPLVVSHSIISSNGCVASVDKTIDVRQAAIFGGNDTVIAKDLELRLQATGGVSYNWEALPPGELINYVPGSATAQPQTQVFGRDFIYVVTGRDAQGCAGRDSVRVTVSDKSYIFVPSAFSPNGDGKNDVLHAFISGGNVLLFAIYNRRGNEVFSTTNSREGWDGRHKGEEAAMDVYYWMLKVQSGYSGHELIYSGDVTLVR